METYKIKTEYFIKTLIIIIVCVQSIISGINIDFKYFMFFLLMFLFVSQTKTYFFKNKLLIFSILIEIFLVYLMSLRVFSFSFLLLFIVLLDSLLLFDAEGKVISFIIIGMLIYILKDEDKEKILLSIVIYFFLFIFSNQVKTLRNHLKQMEYLYDENRNYSYELEFAKKRLEDYARMVEELSQLEERNRISRELHDTLGHKMTGIFMQLEAIIQVAKINASKAVEMFSSARDNMGECIDVLRKTVKGMKPRNQENKILSIRQMVDNFKKTTGIDMDFKMTGCSYELSQSIGLTLYKNAQEAITNAVRHGKADKIRIELLYLPDRVELTVSDNGKGCSQVVKGMGVTGMEERVMLHGGKVTIELEKGFKIKTIIPVR
ncbi:MAG: sensor histidine kinase [Clostridia bacterium]|nr:sensor histidine kinase [Clostridia bacterium]